MRKRNSDNTPSGYLSGGKFQHILQTKYGLKIDKETLVHALASPPDTQIVLQRVALPKPKLLLAEKQREPKRGRHSWLHKRRLRAAKRMS
jgi:hypothetical protein